MGNCAKIFICSFFYMGNRIKINSAQKAQAILCVCVCQVYCVSVILRFISSQGVCECSSELFGYSVETCCEQ